MLLWRVNIFFLVYEYKNKYFNLFEEERNYFFLRFKLQSNDFCSLILKFFGKFEKNTMFNVSRMFLICI